MTTANRLDRIGSISDIFNESHAWARLNEPSPEGVDPHVVRLKHDVRSVITTLLGAMQILQGAWAEALEESAAARASIGKLYAVGVGILVSLVTASLLLAINIIILRGMT